MIYWIKYFNCIALITTDIRPKQDRMLDVRDRTRLNPQNWHRHVLYILYFLSVYVRHIVVTFFFNCSTSPLNDKYIFVCFAIKFFNCTSGNLDPPITLQRRAASPSSVIHFSLSTDFKSTNN